MLVPISWLKEYVPIKLPLPKLLERLSEAGIGVESLHKKEEDTVLELEITPNRPDLLSIGGVAKEVAALQKTKAKLPSTTIPKPKKKLPISIKVDYKLSPRVSTVILSSIKVKESPLWLQERLTSVGLRSINNIVDITNFVMFELGNPLHAFDYDQIKGHTMTVTAAHGGESFTTVDRITYKLPKGANIIKDSQHIIDLCGIKGGLNSGITNKTKTVLLWAAVDDGPNIRKTSQALSLRSDASAIYERGVDRAGTLAALARATTLIRESAGGQVASNVIDLKKEQFNPWYITFSLDRLGKILGISIPEKKVLRILTALNLQPRRLTKQQPARLIECEIPTYRNDLQIEEDIIEEVARLYGYNRFPKTLPKGEIPIGDIPYPGDFTEELKIKQIMTSLSFSEANTYSLVSRDEAKLFDIADTQKIMVANPVSREFEILRPSLLINLVKAIPLNIKHRENIRLFELGRVYRKPLARRASGPEGNEVQESRSLAAVCYPADYFDGKGVVETLFEALSLSIRFEATENPTTYNKQKSGAIFVGDEKVGVVGEISRRILQTLDITNTVAAIEIDIDRVSTLLPKTKIYKPIPKYPPIIEDLSIIADRNAPTGDIMSEIKATSILVAHVDFLDMFEDTRTFRITYQDPQKNLTNVDAAHLRKQILTHLKNKFNAELKS